MNDPDELKEKLRYAVNSCSAEIDAGHTPDFIVADGIEARYAMEPAEDDDAKQD